MRIQFLPAIFFAFSIPALADTNEIPDNHAPVGVMDGHALQKGDVTYSYNYSLAHLGGLRDETSRLSNGEVLSSGSGIYSVAPDKLDVAIHTLGITYAPSDKYSLSATIPWVKNTMKQTPITGSRYDTDSSEVGDVNVTAIIPFGEASSWLVGLNLPTGDLNQKDSTPAGRTLLPYNMQIGSGSYDLNLGYSFNKSFDGFSAGYQAKAVIPISKNDEHYSVGNQYDLTGWYAQRFGDFSWSVRGTYSDKQDYDAADPRYSADLAANLSPAIDASLQSGRRFDVGFGVNWMNQTGLKLGLEYQIPAYEKVDGPQLETDNVLTLGIQFTPS